MAFKKFLLFLSLLGVFNCSFSQGIPGSGYFNYPLSIKPKLNANFGEMRPNHFHMGLDLSTEARENVPVYAPAEGHVSRIKIETGGFGRAIYIDHPNGMTTLYAHMNRFLPQVETYLKEKQYENKTWKIDVAVPAGRFPLKKGQLIGYSGNTGASQGPHVHFEVRDTKTENCLNPLKMGLPLPDQTPPDLFKLALYDRSKSMYDQTPMVVGLTKKDGVYQASHDIVFPGEKVFLAIQATDRMTGAPNANGIYKAELLQDGKLISSFEMENIGYDKTRYLNGHIDYKIKYRGGPYLQMLFPPKNFGLDLYKPASAPGYLLLTDAPVPYTIHLTDANGNRSTALIQLRKSASFAGPEKQGGSRPVFEAGQVNIYDDQGIQFVFGEAAFYDDVDFQVASNYANSLSELSSVFQTRPEFIPVQEYFTVGIRPNRSLSLVNTDRVVIKRVQKTKTEIRKAKLEKGTFSASFRDLGFFQLLEDDQPPVISSSLIPGAVLRAGSRIVIDVKDNLNVISQFTATVDGNWIMFQPSGNRFVYTVDEHLPFGEHKLTVVVYDEAGNSAVKEWIINRN